MNENEIEKGYNSDGDMGLFFNIVYDKAKFFYDDEAEVVTKLMKPVPETPPPDTVIMHADIDTLKVFEVKEELKKRACSIKGAKSKLSLRRKDAIDKNMTLAVNIADTVMDDLAGDEFALGV